MQRLLFSLLALVIIGQTAESHQQKQSGHLPPANLMLLADYPDAVCLDGTPAAYYLSLSTTNSTDWIIYLQGGGICTGLENCLWRSTTFLGSSSTYPPTKSHFTTEGGIISQNCTVNPVLCEYNLVFLNYCDGFLYAGNREAPFVVEGADNKTTTKLYSRGQPILYGMLGDLLTKTETTGFGHATSVLLTGGSAGGWGTFIHSEPMGKWIATNVPTAARKIKAAPLSGFFISRTNYDYSGWLEELMDELIGPNNATASMNPECLADAPLGMKSKCLFSPVLYSYTKIPTFVSNSKFDAFQLSCLVLGTGPGPAYPNALQCNAIPGYSSHVYKKKKEDDCLLNSLTDCTPQQIRPLTAFQSTFSNIIAINPSFRKPGNGAFIDSCFTHVAAGHSPSWVQTSVMGVTMGQAFLNWWLDDNTHPMTPAANHTYIDCDRNTAGGECNPTCNVHNPGSTTTNRENGSTWME